MLPLGESTRLRDRNIICHYTGCKLHSGVRTDLKLAVVAYKCLQWLAPLYLADEHVTANSNVCRVSRVNMIGCPSHVPFYCRWARISGYYHSYLERSASAPSAYITRDTATTGTRIVPQNLEWWWTLMQIVPHIFKNTRSEITKIRHFEQNNHFFLWRGPSQTL